MKWQERTELLVGKKGLKQLSSSHVLVAGLGGVGSFAAEMLCRAGIGTLTLADHDVFHLSNLNRQIGALRSTLERPKTEVMKERLLDINPRLKIKLVNEYLKDENMKNMLNEEPYDFIVDAIDTFSPKTYFIYHAVTSGKRLVSSMGSGGKTRPEDIRAADFADTYQCRLAYMLRKRLRRKNITGGFRAVFSVEPVNRDAIIQVDEENKKSNIGTISYMPAIFGGWCAAEVIQQILKKNEDSI